MTKYELVSKILKSPPVIKESFIQEMCKNKIVLDMGCIRHNADFALQDPNWLHKKIKLVAKKVTGVDYLPEEIDKLKQYNYNIVFGDVTKRIDIDETYEVIVAGDLLEHLSNFEGFFKNCTRLLKENGILILTTPNPFYSGQFHYIAFKRNYHINPEHVCWIDPQALSQLLSRFEYYIDEIHFIKKPWQLGRLITDSSNNEYDILNGKWNKNSVKHKLFRKCCYILFSSFYLPYNFVTGTNTTLCKYSDYLTVVKKKSW